MLEEMYNDEDFKQDCDDYFSMLGHGCIFTMSPLDIDDSVMR